MGRQGPRTTVQEVVPRIGVPGTVATRGYPSHTKVDRWCGVGDPATRQPLRIAATQTGHGHPSVLLSPETSPTTKTMGRWTLISLLAAVLIALGAWLTRLGPNEPDSAIERDPATATSGGSPEADLSGLGGRPARVEVEDGDVLGPTRWTVRARLADGRPAEGAMIFATFGEHELAGTCTAEWPEVAPGTWRLRVTGASGQVIERDVTLRPGTETRTAVRLGTPARIVGTLRNSRGERLREHLVAFLRPDEDIPEDPRRLRGLVCGSTDMSGAFDIDLPETGPWRPAVIFGGRTLFEGSAEEIEPDGLRRRCDIVVGANPRLIVSMEGFDESKAAEELVAISVYRRATPRELEELAEFERRAKEPRPTDPADSDDPDFQEEYARALEADSNPERLAQMARQAKWTSVVPEGWRNVGSSVMPPSGQLVFDHLQHDLEYRLAMRKGNEVMRVDGSVFIGFGEMLHAQLFPPAPVEDPASLEALRSSGLVLRPVALAGQPLVVGATWTH